MQLRNLNYSPGASPGGDSENICPVITSEIEPDSDGYKRSPKYKTLYKVEKAVANQLPKLSQELSNESMALGSSVVDASGKPGETPEYLTLLKHVELYVDGSSSLTTYGIKMDD